MREIEQFVIDKLGNDTTGHDWYHIDRVRKVAIQIAHKEKANIKIVEIAALLHDVMDDKLVKDKKKAKEEIDLLLQQYQLTEYEITNIFYIIETIGFKGGNGEELTSIESKIVQDADRLDALGAIGVARTFMYSGAKDQAMFDPSIPVRDKMDYVQYRTEKSTAINHFYEKLLKLKDTLHTNTAKEIAVERHTFLQNFLDQFMKEWEVK
ncbi:MULTISPECIES: HD domain-containing protein [Bacillus]|uniref:HD domain-containing protein n=1 Tax=Bacillus TaxID=1386 RepID=UPI003872FF96